VEESQIASPMLAKLALLSVDCGGFVVSSCVLTSQSSAHEEGVHSRVMVTNLEIYMYTTCSF
jgi:hypothetical protein